MSLSTYKSIFLDVSRVIIGLAACLISAACSDRTSSVRAPLPDPKFVELGQRHYQDYCSDCHSAAGMGVPGLHPALVGSSVVDGSPEDFFIFLYTLKRAVPADERYEPLMGPVNYFLPEDMAALMTYVSQSFGKTPRVYRAEEIEKWMLNKIIF